MLVSAWAYIKDIQYLNQVKTYEIYLPDNYDLYTVQLLGDAYSKTHRYSPVFPRICILLVLFCLCEGAVFVVSYPSDPITLLI